MKKIALRLISVVLSIVLVMSSLTLQHVSASSVTTPTTIPTTTTASMTSYPYTYTINDDGTTCTITLYDIRDNGSVVMPTSIIIPSTLDGYSVTAIGNSAFSKIPNFKGNFTIPASVLSIDSTAFGICASKGFTVDVNNPNYCSDSNGVLYNKNKTEIIRYPSLLEGVIYTYPNTVTSIGDYAFYNAKLDIAIPSTITNIGAYAFSRCTSQRSLTIPSSVISIGAHAYQSCSALTALTLNNGLISIGDYAFASCPIANLTLPSSVTSLGEYVFDASIKSFTVDQGNPNYSNDLSGALYDKNKTTIIRFPGGSSATTFTIPTTVTTIANGAFGGSALKSITIPTSVTTMGNGAFASSGLSSVTIPNSVTTIGTGAFESCRSLKSVTLPSGLTEIAPNLFSNCDILSTVNIPSGVKTIGHNAFSYCIVLSNITLPNGLTSIGKEAFYWCSMGLQSITIPDTVTTIDDGAFSCCRALSTITLSSGLKRLNKEVLSSCYKLKTVIIPSSVTTICDSAFYDDLYLESITIPSSVTTIEDRAFWQCKSLKSIVVPDSVTSLGSYVFDSNISLKSATLPSGLKSIPKALFLGCKSLTDVTIPSGVTLISDFAFNGCKVLPSINIPSGVTSIGTSSFSGCTVLQNINIPSGVTSIGSVAFRDCTFFTNINIPDSVKTIGQSAFYGCIGLITVHLPSDLTLIEDYTFYGCISLYSINIPRGVITIGQGAFYNCTSLTSITLPNNMNTLGSSAFQGCSALTSISIPNSVTNIERAAFFNCTSLTSVKLPSGLSTINDLSFQNCTSLVSIELPNGLTTINNQAFAYCTNLTSLFIPSSVTTIGNLPFYNSSITTIYGISGSYAQTYAKSGGITFVPIRPGSCTVTFNSNGGSAVANANTSGGSVVFAPADPTKTSNYFTGWYTAATGGTKIEFPFIATANTTLYAQWGSTAVNYTVTFNSNGGSAVANQTIKIGSALNAPQSPYYEGYYFVGWYTAPTGGTQIEFPYTLTGNTTLYAQWSPLTADYTATFSSNGTTFYSKTVKVGSYINTPSTPSNGNYTFLGWFTDQNLGSKITFPYKVTSNTTLFAQWATIRPVSNKTYISDKIEDTLGSIYSYGDTWSTYHMYTKLDTVNQAFILPHVASADTISIRYARGDIGDGKISLYINNVHMKDITLPNTGGWPVDQKNNYKVIDVPVNIPEGSDVKLQFDSDDAKIALDYINLNSYCSISFNSQGGSPVESQFVTTTSSFSAPRAPTKTGYYFTGWYTAPTGGTQIGFPYRVTGDATFYAQWSTTPVTNSTVTYVWSNITQKICNGSMTIAPVGPELEEKSFMGWYTDPVAGVPVTFPFTVTKDVTIYPHFSQTSGPPYYDVIFNTNGGSTNILQTVNTVHPISPPTDPTRSGYYFSGWYTSPIGGTLVSFPYVPTAYTILYAHWSLTPINYTVAFDTGGGSTMASQTEKIGSTVFDPGTPSLSGFAFAGWYTAATGGTQVVFPYTPTANTTIYAHWNIAYTVTYDFQDGNAATSQNVSRGSAIEAPEDPTRLGYIFNGWYTTSSGGTKVTFPYTLTENTTMYAQWTETTTNTVTYNSQGGSAVPSQTVNTGNVIYEPIAPTKTGNSTYTYTFAGWYNARTGGNKIVFPYTVNENVTLYAQWTATPIAKYTVTYNSQGGSAVPSQTVNTGTVISAPTAPTKATDNTYVYTFEGWYDAQTGGNKISFPYTVTGNVTLNAHWTATPITKYTVTYNSQGGSAVPSQTVNTGTVIDEPTAPTKATDNTYVYTFEGWYDAQTGGNKISFPYTVTGNVTLNAHWTATPITKYTVTYNSQGGSAVPSQTVNSSAVINEPTAPTKATDSTYVYTFAGWYDTLTGGNKILFPYTVTGNVTLYAKWTATPNTKYTVTFNANGGSAVPSQTVNSSAVINEPTAPTKATDSTYVYTFAGWYDTQTGGNKILFPYTVTRNVTLYAQWTATTKTAYTVSFNANGGSPDTSQTVIGGSKISAPTDPTYTGHYFAGWYTAATGGNQVTFPYTVNDNTQFYAHWSTTTIKKYTVTFNSNGGSKVANETVNYNETVAVPKAPTKESYTFAGWYTTPALTTAWDFATNNVTADITLYAKWTAVIPSTPISVKSVSSNYKTIKVSWAAASNANQYKVYRATSRAGSYKMIATVSTTSYSNTSLKTGKKYYYKVVAINISSGETSGYSAEVCAAPVLPAVKLSSVRKSKTTSAKVNYSAVSGASGYKIYYGTTSAASKLAGTSKTTIYTKTALVKGKTYYFKVRAYRIVKGKKVYGDWSAVKSVKI